MHCSTISSSASSTRSPVHFTVQITCPPILKPPDHSVALLVRYLPYKLNRIGDKQDPRLTPLPVFALLVSRWSTLTFNTLIHVQFANQSSSWPVDTSFCYDLH
jgi:hypothetical protein